MLFLLLNVYFSRIASRLFLFFNFFFSLSVQTGIGSAVKVIFPLSEQLKAMFMKIISAWTSSEELARLTAHLQYFSHSNNQHSCIYIFNRFDCH